MLKKKDRSEELKSNKIKEISLVKSSELGGAKSDVRGRCAGGGASVWRALGVQRRQRGRKHQHLGLHEGQVGQTGDHFGRLFAQVFLLPGFPVQTGSDKSASIRRDQMQITEICRNFKKKTF